MKPFRSRLLATGALAAGLGALAFTTLAQAEVGPGARGDTREGAGIDRMFARFDADGDGMITREEFDQHPAFVVAETDSDGDGRLSAEELLAAWQARAEARIAALIERLDTDGDGRLSAEEMARPRRDAGRMFERLDTDGDGSITRAEAVAAVSARAGAWRGRHGHGGEGHRGGMGE